MDNSMDKITYKNRDNDFKTRQGHAPIAEAMAAYSADGALAFHTPGHKQGLGAHALLHRLITQEGLRQEVSLMEELDDLHEPEGCIKEAEELAAELWGAQDTMFMINGTTGAIHAMLLGTLKPGDKVLLPRNAHRSIIGGLILAGAEPIYIEPPVEPSLGIPMGLTAELVRKAIKEYPEVVALIAVYPTYYGFACPLSELAELVHSHGMLLLVDEAHGAHLAFSDILPKQALECGADVVAQSTHKLLGSMTQTSMLHIGSDRVSKARVREAAALLQSTSPNQLLLASLDIARLQMVESGPELVERAVGISNWLRGEINEILGLYCAGTELVDGIVTEALDFTKLTVNLDGLSISGPAAELELRHKYKIQCELSDDRNLLFIISIADTYKEASRLLEALKRLAASYIIEKSDEQNIELKSKMCYVKSKKTAGSRSDNIVNSTGSDNAGNSANIENTIDVDNLVDAGNSVNVENRLVIAAAIDARKAFFAERHKVKFAESAGRVSGETVTFYPPGVPVLCPGEVITAELIDYVREMQSKKFRIVGPSDPKLENIEVIK